VVENRTPSIMRKATLLLVLALLVVGAPAWAQSVTLEGLMSAPFPSALVAAPTGGHVAWVQNDRGARNIWVASPPEYRGRQLTAYVGDDGQELGSLTWAPDARTLLFVRGGGANRAGETPNPTSDPAGVEQAIWRVSLDGGAPIRIAQGASPAISPRGDGVAFLRRGQIFWAPLAGGDAVQIVQARGSAGALRWAPDGSRLAFVSNRGTHAFLGIYDLSERSLRFLDASVDRDGNPVWSPDGTRLAYIRTPTSSRLTSFRPIRDATPWSIRVADVASGVSRTIWTAEEGAGSAFYGMTAENQILWGAGDRLVFPWERNGWVNLYSVPVGGGAAVALTPGEFEVEDVSLSADGREVIYSANAGDIDRRDIWQVPVAGGRPVQVTRGEGIEWSPTPTSDGTTIAILRSGARQPARAAVIRAGGAITDISPAVPASFPERALVEPQALHFTAADGMMIPAQLFLPPDLRPGERRPAVVFVHGGSRRQMLLGFHYRDYYHNAYAMNQYLASRGYVVLSINFRSGTGYGMEFREAINYGATGASEFYDVLGAGLYLKNRADVLPDRIGIWGGSYGGYLTAMALSRASDLFAAGVDFHGVHDWNVGIRNFVPSYEPLERPEEARLAFESSPMASLDTWRSPVLVITGDDDRNVNVVETVRLVEELRKRGVPVEQLIFPDDVHGFLLHRNWIESYRATADFLDRHLK
jgi:dipeptidyl aminopeptidase/acylaminoacyl peptidase